jgi:hypothetical protein
MKTISLLAFRPCCKVSLALYKVLLRRKDWQKSVGSVGFSSLELCSVALSMSSFLCCSSFHLNLLLDITYFGPDFRLF